MKWLQAMVGEEFSQFVLKPLNSFASCDIFYKRSWRMLNSGRHLR